MNLLLLIIIISSLVYKTNTDVISVIMKVIQHSFTSKNCIFIIQESNIFISNDLFYHFSEYKIVMFMLTNITTEFTNACTPDGYILLSNNTENIKHLCLSKELLPYKRLLIIFEGDDDFNKEPFFPITQSLGIDIVVIKYLISEENVWNFPNPNITEIFSITHRKLIDPISINSKDFPQEIWKPNFENKTFKIAIFNCPPFLYYSTEYGIYNGVEKFLIDSLLEGWPVELITYEESSWNLRTNDVLGGKADAGFCCPWQLLYIGRRIDQTYSYAQICGTFLVPKPQLLNDVTFVIRPLKYSLWFVFLMLTCTFGLLVYTFFTFLNTKRDLILCLMFAYEVVTSGSSRLLSSAPSNSIRLLVAVWFCGKIFLNTVYSAGITIGLAVPKYSKPISTLEDMIEQNIFWGDDSTLSLELMNGSHNIYTKRLTERFIPQSSIADKYEYMKQHKDFALTTEYLGKEFLSATEHLDDYGKNNLKIMSECYEFSRAVVLLQWRSPFTKIFSERIIKFQEHGLIKCWYEKTKLSMYSEFKNFGKFFTIYKADFQVYNVLELNKLLLIFYCLFFGNLLAVLVFVIELVVNKYYK